MANSIDTELENALSRAQQTSASAGTLFNDVVTGLVYPNIPQAARVNQPSLQGLTIAQPADPDTDEINAQLEAMKSATDAFADTYFPPQPETDAAIAEARELLVSYMDGSAVPLATFMETYLGSVLDVYSGYSPEDALSQQTGLTVPPRFYTTETVYADKLKGHYDAMRLAFRAKLDARMLAEFRKYAMGLLLKIDVREEAIRATSSYVLALGEVENSAGENLVRLNQAKAAMASSIGKWFAAQISNDVGERVEFAGAKYEVGKDIVAGSAQYAEIEAKVRAAQSGANTLMELASNARNTISAITSAAKVGFE